MSATNPQTLAAWLLQDGFSLYEDAFKEETTTSPSRSGDEQLVQQAFADGPNDIRRKLRQTAFFSANAAIFLKISRLVCERITAAANQPHEEVFRNVHAGLLRKLVLDSQWLLEEWATTNVGVSTVYGIVKTPRHLSLPISHAVQQLYFGGSPFFAFTDNASESAIAVLRVAIETRLRFGFGILGAINKRDGAFVPLKLSLLLAALKQHQASIQLAVPLADIQRIYGWTNTYIHTGLRDYIWLPQFGAMYLNVFLRGGRHRYGNSAFSGIITTKETVVTIQRQIARQLRSGKQKLFSLGVDDCEFVTTRRLRRRH